jgi:REP element-mobilizing transposase RayT
MNHCAGDVTSRPFEEVVYKESFVDLLMEASAFFTLRLLAYAVMSNHWHVVCVAPGTAPEVDEMQRRWRVRYGTTNEPDWSDSEVVARIGKRMCDISEFCKDIQQRFTSFYNRVNPVRRFGTLWSGRFKSQLLEDGPAVREAIKYVEMNPVRAGICESPEAYRFSSWGHMAGSGKHPFQAALVEHLRRLYGCAGEDLTDKELIVELGKDMARIAAAEKGGDEEAIRAAGERAGKTEPFVLTVVHALTWSGLAAADPQSYGPIRN